MKAPWCASLPVVRVPRGQTPKAVTFILPFYENAQFLGTQLAWWQTFPAHVRAHLSAIIVDDCSPVPAAPVLASIQPPFPIRLFRIGVDRRWNWLAARNIGAHHAPDGWCLLTDMDHVVPATTAEVLVYGRHDATTAYAFSRMEQTGDKIAPHSASFFMTRELFWKVGGYDERYSGLYGSDGVYRKRLASRVPIVVATDRLVRHEYDGDSSTTRYLRKQQEDTHGLRRLAATIPPGSAPQVLSFPYEEVAC